VQPVSAGQSTAEAASCPTSHALRNSRPAPRAHACPCWPQSMPQQPRNIATAAAGKPREQGGCRRELLARRGVSVRRIYAPIAGLMLFRRMRCSCWQRSTHRWLHSLLLMGRARLVCLCPENMVVPSPSPGIVASRQQGPKRLRIPTRSLQEEVTQPLRKSHFLAVLFPAHRILRSAHRAPSTVPPRLPIEYMYCCGLLIGRSVKCHIIHRPETLP
jgi:hypothetical protein